MREPVHDHYATERDEILFRVVAPRHLIERNPRYLSSGNYVKE
jgi:hypothetical protein